MTPPPNPTFNLLVKPIHPGVQASATNLATYNAAKAIWNKENAQALGLMQATVSPVIWETYAQYDIAKDLFDALETQFRKSIDLPPIGQHGENPIHLFNGCVVSDTTIPREIQSNNIEWP